MAQIATRLRASTGKRHFAAWPDETINQLIDTWKHLREHPNAEVQSAAAAR
jgi:hypothetical protein